MSVVDPPRQKRRRLAAVAGPDQQQAQTDASEAAPRRSARNAVRVLNLCSGTESLEAALRSTFGEDVEIVTVEKLAKYKPTHCVDIRKWDYKGLYREHHFQVIWASPPCTEYSRAKSTGKRRYGKADAIVRRCLEIIDDLAPVAWFMENPSTGKLPGRPCVEHIGDRAHRCTYCMYGEDFMKPTMIWSNLPLDLEECTAEHPCAHVRRYGKHPVTCQTGRSLCGRKGVPSERSGMIPVALATELFAAAKTAIDAR